MNNKSKQRVAHNNINPAWWLRRVKIQTKQTKV